MNDKVKKEKLNDKSFDSYKRKKKDKATEDEDMSYKGDPVLNKYLKRGKGYDFSDITKEDKKYLRKKGGAEILLLKPEMMGKGIGLMKDGGEVKKYRGGGSVHNNEKQYGTQGYRSARKPK